MARFGFATIVVAPNGQLAGLGNLILGKAIRARAGRPAGQPPPVGEREVPPPMGEREAHSPQGEHESDPPKKLPKAVAEISPKVARSGSKRAQKKLFFAILWLKHKTWPNRCRGR